jgi:hypothetical protein
VADHPQLSPDFRRIAIDNQARLDSLRQRFG